MDNNSNTNNNFLFGIITIFVAIGLGSFFILFTNAKTAFFATILIMAIAFAYKYPQYSLWFFLIYLPFGGTITYAFGDVFNAVGGRVTYSNTDYAIFHFAKDAFYFPPLIALTFSGQYLPELYNKYKPIVWASIGLLLTSLLTLFFVNALQPHPPSEKPFLMGIMGLKILIGYIPLIICGYFLIKNKRNLLIFNRLTSIVIITCCSLALIQYSLLITGVCSGNVGLDAEVIRQPTLQARCFVGGSLLYNPNLGLLRLPGTFVAPWQWGWFLIAGAFFTYGSKIIETGLKWKITHWIAMVLLLITALFSGQRIALILVPIIFLILLIFTETNKKLLPLKLGLIFLITLVIVNSLGIVSGRIDDFIGRWQYSPPNQFIISQFEWILQGKLSLLGNGLGRATSAARRLGNIALIETFYPRLLYEIGIIGTVAFLTLVTIISVTTFKIYQSLQDQSLRHFALCLWVFIVFISYNTYYYPLAVDPVAVYYWFIVGIILALPKIEG
jgi:hypothetical protein